MGMFDLKAWIIYKRKCRKNVGNVIYSSQIIGDNFSLGLIATSLDLAWRHHKIIEPIKTTNRPYQVMLTQKVKFHLVVKV